MVDEAPLAETGAGLVPQGDGWFVVNVRDAAWLRNDAFGARCTFEADGRITQEQPELHLQRLPQLGIRVHVLEPGEPSTMYHRESQQEGFLVLSGECLLVVEGEERPYARGTSSTARRARRTRSWARARGRASSS